MIWERPTAGVLATLLVMMSTGAMHWFRASAIPYVAMPICADFLNTIACVEIPVTVCGDIGETKIDADPFG